MWKTSWPVVDAFVVGVPLIWAARHALRALFARLACVLIGHDRKGHYLKREGGMHMVYLCRRCGGRSKRP